MLDPDEMAVDKMLKKYEEKKEHSPECELASSECQEPEDEM